MTLGEFLKESTKLLKDEGIESARLDCLILMEHVTGINRATILAHDDQKLPEKHKNVLNVLLDQRSRRIPITQLTNKCEFYGREFYINEFVMSPRPETETMIDLFLDLVDHDKSLKSIEDIQVADIGTGSGAIGITLKHELPKLSLTLLDNNPRALQVVKINVVLHTIDVSVIENDLINNLHNHFDVLLCNLPYVPDGVKINEEAKHEPKTSIFGGPDGLDTYRELFRLITEIQKKPLFILTESFPDSHPALRDIAKEAKYKQLAEHDYVQTFTSVH